jgi:membrane-associated phospholipid phosphatase
MNFLTDFADQAVVLPLAGTVLLVLFAVGWRRGAVAWGAGVGGVLAVMLVLKLLALACLRHLGWLGLSSPSGHTAASAVVYGGLLALLAPRGTVVAAIAGGAVALVFGLSRLALHVHTVPDVILGALVGVAGAILMRRAAGPRPPRSGAPWLLLAAFAVMVAFHGHRLQAETQIRWMALDLWPLDRCR